MEAVATVDAELADIIAEAQGEEPDAEDPDPAGEEALEEEDVIYPEDNVGKLVRVGRAAVGP
jgi:hypothetical protein